MRKSYASQYANFGSLRLFRFLLKITGAKIIVSEETALFFTKEKAHSKADKHRDTLLPAIRHNLLAR